MLSFVRPLCSTRLNWLSLNVILVLSLFLAATTAGANSVCTQSTDAEIYALIDSLRVAGAAIVIDGSDSDWSAFPTSPDAADDLVGNPGQEIVAGAIAPLVDRIKFFVRTAGAPPQTDGAFAVSIEVLGGTALDAQIVLNPVSGMHVFVPFDVQNNPLPPAGFITDPALAIGFGSDFIEVDIPYSLLIPFLPDLALPNQRGWVRGGFVSLSGATVLDFGPGTTSYRLIATPYDLDAVLTPNPMSPRQMSLPLQGQWLISQGAFGEFSHTTYWAYDFAIVDSSFNRSSPPGSVDNADYFAFGEPILAPTDGTITQSDGTNPDVPPLNPVEAPFNIVEMDVGGGLSISMLHEKQGSVIVNVNDVVTEGQTLAEVGNSGYTTSAHLHLEVNESGFPLGGSGRGVELTNVRVSLNPVPLDPWARECTTWEIREGFLVESIPPPSTPAVDATGSWQYNYSCQGDVGFTRFNDLTVNLATGDLEHALGSDCGSASFGSQAVPIETCSMTPNPMLGSMTAFTYTVPLSGFTPVRNDYETPIVYNLFCGTTPIAATATEIRHEAIVTEHTGGTATRIEGEEFIGVFDFLDESDVSCFSGDLTGQAAICTFYANRNGVAAGSGVAIEPIDGGNITFDNVTTPGTVEMVFTSAGSVTVPPTFQVLDPPTFFNISTNATFTGDVLVCLPYSDDDDDGIVDGTGTDETTLEMLRNGAAPTLQYVDPNENQVCGYVPGFSEFVLGVSGTPAVDSLSDAALVMLCGVLLVSAIAVARERDGAFVR